MFSRFQWPYRSNNSYPFYSSNYPPVFHLATVPLVWLFGPRYWTGRLVSYLGTLITSAVIGYAVQRETKIKWLALVSGLAYLASNTIYRVGPLFRQHLFMVMFETVAVVLLTVVTHREESSGNRSRIGILTVLILLLLAGYTKQLAYGTVIAVFGWLFLRNWRRAIIWAIPFGAVTGLIFLFLNIATGGEWMTATVTANINQFLDGQALGLFKMWRYLHLILILVSVGVVLQELYFSRLSLYAVWFVVVALNAFVTAGKWGAGESYYATAISAVCILGGIGFGRVLNHTEEYPRMQMAAKIVIPLLLLVQANRMFHLPTHTPFLRSVASTFGKPTEMYVRPQTSCSPREPLQLVPYYDSSGPSLLGRPPSVADREAGLRIVEYVNAGASPAFSEEAAFNLWAGRDVVTNPTQLLNLYNSGAVDLSEMLAQINEKAFDTVIFRGQLYPPPVLEAIGQNYQTVDQIQMNGFIYCILQPKQ